ncbi:hypothetical protein RMATCC62417_07221 [Rhizopus microsporus]|nr:hypothetical protein RMATCC62417_07221 [Rhizopus microsporus]
MEKTFSIVPLRLKDEIKQSARQKGLRIMMTSPIESSCELTELIQIKQLPVFALVLQGKGAIQVWSSFMKEMKKGTQKDIFYASNSLEDAEREIRLFQTAVTNDLSVKKNTRKSTHDAATSTTRSAAKSTLQPNNNNRQQARKNVVASSRKASDGVTNKKTNTTTNNSPAATNKKLLAPKGGVSKNTPPKSVVTGRTRKLSKVSEKSRPVAHSERDQVTESVIKEATVEESVTKDDKQQEINLETEQEQEKQESDGIQVIKEEIEQDEIVSIQHEPVSHLSTCSSAVSSDEHDAEVAAATRMMKNDTTIEDSLDRYSPIKGRSSSTLSPNSVASLPRPETPEVTELRLKFENIIQTGNLDKMAQRPTSKMSNEFVSRIKEMKPRDPTGTRVKSMVEFFMDENLNKWEF